MKGPKLTKTSWLILSAGIFVVVLASLGVTRSQQLQAQDTLSEELGMSETRLSNLNITQLQQQLETLQARLGEGESQLAEARDRLRQRIKSVDVTEKFFVIAGYCNVRVTGLTTTTIKEKPLEDIDCSMISLSASVTGDVASLIDFIFSLNHDYTTGYVGAAQIDILETSEAGDPSANIQMVVYSYESYEGN